MTNIKMLLDAIEEAREDYDDMFSQLAPAFSIEDETDYELLDILESIFN